LVFLLFGSRDSLRFSFFFYELMDSVKSLLPKFTGEPARWPFWKNCVLSHFLLDSEASVLLDHVERNRALPAESKGDKGFTQTNKQIYAVVFKSLTESCHKHVQHVTLGDGCSLWLSLLQEFERSSHASTMDLFNDLLNLTLDADHDVPALELKLRLNIDMLDRALGLTFPETFRIVVFLRALPREYDNVRNIIRAREKISFERTVEIVKDSAKSMTSPMTSNFASRLQSNANFAGSGTRQSRPHGPRRARSSSNCGICLGQHHISSCPLPCVFCKKKSNGQCPFQCPRRPSRPACFRCGRIGGHLSRSCPVNLSQANFAANAIDDEMQERKE
jgi:hypothetical protein